MTQGQIFGEKIIQLFSQADYTNDEHHSLR
jgi:hypothetical protein